MTKIISYNVNGLRAAIRKGWLQWLEAARPDVVCLQEVKALPEQLPVDKIRALGYHCHWFPAQKLGYSGVAILSLEAPKMVVKGSGSSRFDVEGRIIRADFENFSVWSVYVPSSATKQDRQDYKFAFLNHLKEVIATSYKKNKRLILAGDMNICPEAIDLHNPVMLAHTPGFLPWERDWVKSIKKMGFSDSLRTVNPHPHQYTWWSYTHNHRAKNLGWRIDQIYVAAALSSQIERASVLIAASHSDHCPCFLQLAAFPIQNH